MSDVALGAGSVTGARNSLTSIKVGGVEVGNNGKSSGTAVLAVGNSTAARQVQYVSAGLISANSTDAINGSQLYQVVSVLNTTASTATAALSTATIANTTANAANTTANTANTTANKANTTANLANTTANTANTTCEYS